MRIQEVWLIGMLAVASPLLLVASIGWWRASRRARHYEARLLDPPSRHDGAERLERLIESLAVQVDELASGQEFLHRVLAERDARKALNADASRIATPV